MSKWRSRWSNYALNASIIFFGALVLLLLFALATRSLAPRVDPLRDDTEGPLVGAIIQVEVLNGVGESNLAAEVNQYLRKKGFDVVLVEDYDHYDVEFSEVVDRIGDRSSALRVANALGIPEERVREEIVEDLYLDATVVIGHDFRQLRFYKDE